MSREESSHDQDRRAEILLAGRNRILEMVVSNSPLEETLAAILLMIESQFDGMICSVLLLDQDGLHTRHGAGARLPEAYRRAIDGKAIGPKEGSCGTAMFRGEQVIVSDILKDPLWDEYRDLAVRCGLRACWSTPILSHSAEILGSFAVYCPQPGSPGPIELELIKTATRIASVAIERWQSELDRQRAQENLRLAELKYRSIFEQAVFGIFQSTPEGVCLSANPALARMFGHESAAEFMASTTAGLQQFYVDPESRAKFVRTMDENGNVHDFEVQAYRKNGSVMWLSISAHAIRDGGRVVRYEGMCQDITERKVLEKQLFQAQKMEAVGRLAGGISHDFNNILGVILGQGELLLKKLQPSETRWRIEQICQAGQRAAALTGRLLAFSRQQILQPAALDLNQVVENLATMLNHLIGEDVALVLSLDPELGPINAEAGQIEQLLMNLVVNARDAMPRGGKLTICTFNFELDESFCYQHAGTKPGQCVALTVSDTGTGLDEKTSARLFEPFFTTKESGKGTGLGLATVYGIVKQSGGYISVDSELGKGTAFSIYLPRVTEGGNAKKPGTFPPALACGNETLLLVEDAAPLRDVTREFLKEVGYVVLEAHDALDALKMAKHYQAEISLLITDVVLPGMNGRELAEQLILLRPGMKVLYISGYTDDAIVRHGVSKSELTFLEKPFTQDALTRKVREMLDAPT
jgi:two-component system cell cycle sensor histidine kinase/response regulator CckA